MPLIDPNYNLPAPTAWGNTRVAFLPAPQTGGVDTGAMPDLDTMKYVGYVLEDTLTIEYTEGTVLELIEEGGIVRDRRQNNGTVTLNFSIIGNHGDVITNFWDATVAGTGDSELITVNSMATSRKFAIYMEPDTAGAQDMRIPYATVDMQPGYSTAQGWVNPVVVTILTGPANYMYQIGRAAARPVTP